jgi:2-iminobutanoate/2-iminopropanoate deaminase
MPKVEASTPANTPTPIGPYSHVAKVGWFISIGAIAGVDPATGLLAGPDVESQTRQILDSFELMLSSAGSDLAHVVHVNIFLAEMSDFEAMNAAYIEKMGDHRPARRPRASEARSAPDHELDGRYQRLNLPAPAVDARLVPSDGQGTEDLGIARA